MTRRSLHNLKINNMKVYRVWIEVCCCAPSQAEIEHSLNDYYMMCVHFGILGECSTYIGMLGVARGS